eukprot:2491757-Prymnesium_polylepis.1
MVAMAAPGEPAMEPSQAGTPAGCWAAALAALAAVGSAAAAGTTSRTCRSSSTGRLAPRCRSPCSAPHTHPTPARAQ